MVCTVSTERSTGAKRSKSTHSTISYVLHDLVRLWTSLTLLYNIECEAYGLDGHCALPMRYQHPLNMLLILPATSILSRTGTLHIEPLVLLLVQKRSDHFT